MPFILKQVGGNVKVTDTNGENLGYFDRSQIECNFNPLDKTVSVTMIGNTVVTLPPVTPGGILTIDTVTGGAVDITTESLFDTNYALLFPKLGGGSTINAGIYVPNILSVNTNIDSCTAKNGFFHRISDIVSFWFIVDVTVTAGPVTSYGEIILDIPVNSNFISIFDATGNGNSETNLSQCFLTANDAAPNQLILKIPEIILSATTRYFVCSSYQII